MSGIGIKSFQDYMIEAFREFKGIKVFKKAEEVILASEPGTFPYYFKYWRDPIATVRLNYISYLLPSINPQKILHYRCGIGTEGLSFAVGREMSVDFMDCDEGLDYLEWRFEKYGVNERLIEGVDFNGLSGYDLCIAYSYGRKIQIPLGVSDIIIVDKLNESGLDKIRELCYNVSYINRIESFILVK